MTAHVRQIDRCGCAVACMAMVRGVPYEFVRADVGRVGRGHDFMAWQDYLARHGFAAQMVWHTDQISQARRDPWPLQPWANVHLCCVDAGHGSASHLVVMLADGTVLDPASDVPRRLSDYPSVAYMAGVFRVGKQPLASATPPASCDGSAEGGETGTGSTEGNSAVREAETQGSNLFLEEAREALTNCAEAVAFFDQVRQSSPAEQIAVGSDHWNWLEQACRRAGSVSLPLLSEQKHREGRE